jgi:major membrane immunogen (membrane-anchored lipoprotein)
LKLKLIINSFNMNITHTKFSFKTLYTLLTIAAVTLISACGKSDETPINIGSFSVYNASPTFSTYDIYLNGSRLNSAALPFGGGVKYTQLAQGTYDAKFTVAGETTSIYTKTGISIGNSAFTTLYLTGTTGNFDGVLVPDDFGSPAADKAYVRFINLSPDAPALDLKIKDGAVVTTNKAYKAYGGFTAVDPGAKIFEIKETVSGNVKSTLESATLGKATFYTIISRGKLTPAGPLERSFGGQVIVHQ